MEYKYFNRELSWLAFNKRVLNLCSNKSFPLLERVRFLSIVGNNLDEFFEIRVAGLQQQLESKVVEVGFDGLGTQEQLDEISKLSSAMTDDAYLCWNKELKPALAKEGINFKTPKTCSEKEKIFLKKYFENYIYPALTPLAVDPAHPFPHLRNKGIYVLLSIAEENVRRAPSQIAIVPIPPNLSRIIKIGEKRKETNFVFLSDTVKYFAQTLFPGYKVRNSAIFRITRNSDLYFDEEETENLLKTIENELHNRRKGAAVRLEIEDSVSDSQLNSLVNAIDLDRKFIYRIKSGPINLARLSLAYENISRPDLKFKPYRPKLPTEFHSAKNIFDTIKEKDRLLHHPYESFAPVENFIDQAAHDPSVLAIKLTLYRTGSESPIVKSLKEAAENGKQVTVLIELKARFDEENNIQWARQLEERGVHVVYGIVGYKTHCKICLIVRRENDGTLKRYAHLGTGNYNSKTAKAYTDLSFFTAKKDITEEVAKLFNTLTGKVAKPEFKKLIVAPFCFHSKFLELVQRETENAKKGKPARIIIKVNSLIEQSSIDALYKASQAGVKIDLIVRGICGLVPQLKGISENINVKSIVGIYLEHSRIYYFENAGNPEVYAGSGDIMTRNMFKRIECIYPIEDDELKSRIIDNILPAYLKDNLFSSTLNPNGSYSSNENQKPPFSAQIFYSS